MILAPDRVRPFPVEALRADVLRETPSGWEVWSEGAGSAPRRLARPMSKAAAEKRLAQIEWFKAHPRGDSAADLVALARAHRLMHSVDASAKARQRGPHARVPRQIPPTAIMVRYAASLLQIMAHARRAYEPLIKALPGLVEAMGAANRGDGCGDGCGDGQRDDGPHDRARDLAAAAAKGFREQVRAPDLERIARRVAGETQSWNREQIRRQVRAVVGVDPVFRDKRLAPMVDSFAAHNAALIERIPEKLHADVQEIVSRRLREGAHVDVLTDEIQERFDVTERHARVIARDQVGKLVGSLNKVRQQDLGITRYRWRTSQDERVRGNPAGKYPRADPSHFDLEGEVFEWDGDEPTDADGEHMIPGQDFQCRCYSEPVLDDILGAIEGDDEEPDEGDE